MTKPPVITFSKDASKHPFMRIQYHLPRWPRLDNWLKQNEWGVLAGACLCAIVVFLAIGAAYVCLKLEGAL